MRHTKVAWLATVLMVLACSSLANSTEATFTAACPKCFTDFKPSFVDSITGTVFTIATGGVNVTGKNFYGPGVYPADFLIEDSEAFGVANTLTISLPATYKVVTLTLGSFNGPLGVMLSDGQSYTLNNPTYGGLAPFSFYSSAGISSVTLDINANDTFVLTRLVYAATPEPGTLPLLASGGLALFGGLRRRLRRAFRG